MPTSRHPIYGSTPPGTFCAAAVGVIRNYPTTEAAFVDLMDFLETSRAAAQAAGTSNRRGVPNGWKGQRLEVARLREEATIAAGVVAASLSDCRNSQGPDERLDPEVVNYVLRPDLAVTDDQRAELAMTWMISVIISPTHSASDRLRAIRGLLPYILASPARVSVLPAPSDSLRWLQGLVEQDQGV